MGADLSFRSRLGPRRTHHPAAPRTHPVRRSPLANRVWRGLRRLPPSNVTAYSRYLLRRIKLTGLRGDDFSRRGGRVPGVSDANAKLAAGPDAKHRVVLAQAWCPIPACPG